MARMPAEERKQELIEIALKLFLERGYKNVTIPDILKAVDGQNGMFYHHFKSKDSIYQAAMDYFITTAADNRIAVITDTSKTFSDRLRILTDSLQVDAVSFTKTFEVANIDLAFLMQAVDGFLKVLVKPVAEALLQAKANGEIPDSSIICVDNSEAAARFILYGSNSLARIRPEESLENNDAKYVLPFIKELLHLQ